MATQCGACKVDMVKKMEKVGTDGTPVWKWVCPKCGEEVGDGRADNENADSIERRAEDL